MLRGRCTACRSSRVCHDRQETDEAAARASAIIGHTPTASDMRESLGRSASELRLEFNDKRLDQGPLARTGGKFSPRVTEQIVPMPQSVGVYGVRAQSASTPDGRH